MGDSTSRPTAGKQVGVICPHTSLLGEAGGGCGPALEKMSIEMRQKGEEKNRQREQRGLKNRSDWRGRGGDVRRTRRLRAKQKSQLLKSCANSWCQKQSRGQSGFCLDWSGARAGPG